MAEKSSDLTNREDNDILEVRDLDAVSANAGASNDSYLEIDAVADGYSADTLESREVAINTSADATDETEHLRAQIEETRTQMGETIDAIQEKLSFQNISDQVKEQISGQISTVIETAKDSIYDATIRKAGEFMQSMNRTLNQGLDGISNSEIIQTARANPLALSLIGLGIGMLLMNSYRGRSTHRGTGGNGRDYQKGLYASSGETQNQSSGLESVSDTAGSAYNRVSSATSGALSSVTNVAGTAVSGVTSAASTAIGGVSNAANTAIGGVTTAASQAYQKVGDFGHHAREQYDHYLEESPLAVGAVALALGAAVGMAIPATRVEGELMGEAKQNLLHLAQDRAGELVNKVKQVASEAGSTIQEEAQAQGLTQ